MSHLYAGEDTIKPENFIYQQGFITVHQELGDEHFEKKPLKDPKNCL